MKTNTMKTKNKISAYILRGSTAALLFSCVIVALCSAINLPQQPLKALPPRDNAAFGANAHRNRSLSFADRVAYQRAIEDVYWRHRIWPDTNSGPKPSLDAVMSQTEIDNKVEDYLRNSQALEDYWQRPITADQLQAEMERMASHTKQPDVLREVFEALGNDPFVIAECLARPLLAERFANGDPVAAAVPPAQPTRLPPQKPALAGWLAKAERQVPMTMAAVTSANYALPVIASPSGGCTDDTWTPTTLINAPSARNDYAAVWTGTEMIVWGGFNGITNLNTGGRYNPSTDSWTATSTTNAPSGRTSPSRVWTGTEMIVWGGNANPLPNTGGRYDPSTDSWTATSTTNAPSPRVGSTSAWTGSEMIVWGGFNGFSFLNTGGRYDPDTDSWTATSTTNAPSPRVSAAVWTGSEMIVWGGGGNTGGRYDPNTDSWTATSTTNAPTGGSAAAWTGSEMIVYNAANTTGGRYDPGTDSWTATSTTNAPSARSQHSTVWTGSEMIIWGGLATPPTHLNTGGRYDPGTDSWTATSITDAPSVRRAHRAVWTGSEMIVWGGVVGAVRLNTGGRYCAQPGVCVFLQGFWKNQPEAWPVTELQLGNVTYTQEELLSILHEPVGGNGLLILAHQEIAAKLNIANGADGSCIHQTLANADFLIGDLVVPPVGNGYLKPRDAAGIAEVLGSYNEGNLCAPSCDNGSPDASSATALHHYAFGGPGVIDSVGTANGTLLNGASVSAGQLHLDGVDDYVQFQEDVVPTVGDFSVAFFAQEVSPQATYTEIISQGFSTGPGFYVGYDPDHNFRIGDDLLFTGIPFPSDGFLHHYAVTAGSDTRLYIDGSLVATFGPISTRLLAEPIPGWAASSNRTPSSSTAISMSYGFSAVRLPPTKLQPWRLASPRQHLLRPQLRQLRRRRLQRQHLRLQRAPRPGRHPRRGLRRQRDLARRRYLDRSSPRHQDHDWRIRGITQRCTENGRGSLGKKFPYKARIFLPFQGSTA